MITIIDEKKVTKMLEEVLKCLNSSGKAKLIKVGTARWANALTRELQDVNNVYVLGWQSSERPIIINDFKINDKVYAINDKFSHANISYSKVSQTYVLKGDGEILPESFELTLNGQEICSAMTAFHVYDTDEEDITRLLRLTLASQNFDDAFTEVISLSNSDMDYTIACGETNVLLLKESASPIEMLLGLSAHGIAILGQNSVNKRLKRIIDLEPNEVWAKLKHNHDYEKFSKEFISESKNRLSKYYPVFSYEDIQKMDIEIAKERFDLGVYGLGSAGTAILDQVCRSNWIKGIYICDFDYVENKNMINQWYTNSSLGMSKVDASVALIKNLERPSREDIIGTRFYLDYDNNKFEDTNLQNKIFKYIVSGFDSIYTREEFFNKIIEGELQAKYLIDCRYLDLACSIYMIDLDNQEEVDFYKANLKSDKKLIEARNMKKLTQNEFVEWATKKNYFNYDCVSLRRNILQDRCATTNCSVKTDSGYYAECKSAKCIDYLYNLYIKSCPNDSIRLTYNSCVKYNYIDIYKYVGAIVFGAMRKIENDNKKPFTLVEAATDIDGLPNCLVVRR